jgi:YgiT-type zinc finger domain-containing protein
MARRRHGCGGALVPQDVLLEYGLGGMIFHVEVPGFVCNRCGQRLIEPETFESVRQGRFPHTFLYRSQSSYTDKTRVLTAGSVAAT